MAHVSQEKKDIVAKLVKLITEYPIIGAVNMENLPAPALQKMKASLRDQAFIWMAKRRLMKVAFAEAEKTKKDISKLVDYLRGMPALIFTKENPFKIYKKIKQSKSPAPAKPGQIAPKDIEVKAGPTPFMPGPIIGELGQIGIKTGVENGKVAIKEDAVVVKEGEEIKANVAGLLTRLGIEPMELGLDITAFFEDGVIYDRKVLDIDEDKFLSDLTQAAAYANNLAVEIAFPTKDTTDLLIGKAFREAKTLGIECNVLDPEIIEELIARGEAQAIGIKTTANIETGAAKPVEEKKEAPAEEKKEEPKPEEKPAELPKEEPKPEEKPAEPPKEEPKPEPKVEEAPKEEKKDLMKEKKDKITEGTKDEVPDDFRSRLLAKIEEKLKEKELIDEMEDD
jgi:large subunit ribosomal protein L10